MSYVIAAYGITIAALLFYAVALHRERARQVDEARRQD